MIEITQASTGPLFRPPAKRFAISRWLATVTVVGSFLSTAHADDASKRCVKPAYLSAYDFASRDDLKLAYHLRPLVSGDLVEDWPILDRVEDLLGERIGQVLSSTTIAETITHAMPVEGQPAMRKVNTIVDECCAILHVDKPEVFVRNHIMPQAYVTNAGSKDFLVLTSALLNLYEGAEEELRFVIGHELGHLKCNHLPTKRAAYGILSMVRSIDLAIVPEQYQAVLPSLGLGRLFSWSRDAEISADRAGLLCCQNPQVAYTALLRLLSGVEARSLWVDPESPDFDADEVIRQFRAWENEPFVRFVMYFKRQSAQAPFIPERLAALKQWSDSAQFKAILRRSEPLIDDSTQIAIVKSVAVFEVAGKEESADPYLIAYDGERKLFNTTTADNHRNARWREVNQSYRCQNGQPLTFEIWDDDWGSDRLIGGFTIFPVNPQSDSETGSTHYKAPLIWDWKERTGLARSGYAEVHLEFLELAK